MRGRRGKGETGGWRMLLLRGLKWKVMQAKNWSQKDWFASALERRIPWLLNS